MTSLIIALALIALFYLAWLAMPWIKRRAQQAMINRMEDYVRRAAGMPPREKKRSSNPFTRKSQTRGDRQTRSAGRRYDEPRPAHIIPPEYAEDVEYVEYKDYGSHGQVRADREGVTYTLQEQVSDVQWVEIKDKK